MSMTFGEIIKHSGDCELLNYIPEKHDEMIIKNIGNDTRTVNEDSLFVASRGNNFDSHIHLEKVIESGAKALIVERRPDLFKISVPVILVRSSYEATKKLAAQFFSNPSHRLCMLGITGTNGKTTTSYFARSVFAQKYGDCGLIGTIKYIIGNESIDAPNTSPEPLFFQKQLGSMVENGLKCAVMEVSSHAIKLGRIENTEYDHLIFTNLSKEHTEFHPDMHDYFKTKASLFLSMLTAQKNYKTTPKYAIINIDDHYGEALAAELKKLPGSNIFTYSLNANSGANLTAIPANIRFNGVDFYLNYKKLRIPIELNMSGVFNVYNALAAAAAGICENMTFDEIKAGLEYVTGVPGRFERIEFPGFSNKYSVYVDFAHTPESFINVLKLARGLNPGRIITVFGCGGDRSQEKRPIMGYNAAQASDYVIVTSDNPRTEDPMNIINDILPGVMKAGGSNYAVETDRELAIERAIKMASDKDIVLILGKGHENYQIVGNIKKRFDDCQTALKYIKQRENY